MVQKSGRRTKRTVYEEISRRMLTDARFLLKHGRWPVCRARHRQARRSVSGRLRR
jgi:hypothetical protein